MASTPSHRARAGSLANYRSGKFPQRFDRPLVSAVRSSWQAQNDPLLSVTTVCYRETQSKRRQRWDPLSIEGEDFPSDAKSRMAARSRRCGSARL